MKPRASTWLSLAFFSAIASCSHATRDVVKSDEANVVDDRFIAHEWGTFTTMQGANGGSLEGLQHETESLPAFVHSKTTASPSPFRLYGDTSLDVPVHHCTGKMETPVIYFYTRQPRQVSVHVDFEKGLLTQWYPRARTSVQGNDPSAFDLGQVSRSSLDWTLDLLPDGPNAPSVPPVSNDDPWAFAREVRSAYVRNTVVAGEPAPEAERYVFYRGLAQLQLPVRVMPAALETTYVQNLADAPIEGAFLLDMRDGVGRAQPIGQLDRVSVKPVSWEGIALQPKQQVVSKLESDMSAVLVARGLYADEARAMVRTWSRTWFSAEGTRVVYVIPQATVEAVLPLTITPKPDVLVRVLVGRHEYLTPERKEEIANALRDRMSSDETVRAAAMTKLAHLGRFLEPAVREVGLSNADPLVHAGAAEVLDEAKPTMKAASP
jgi:hypothetical protein